MIITTCIAVVFAGRAVIGLVNKSAELKTVHRLTQSSPKPKGASKETQEAVGHFRQKDYLLSREEIEALKQCPLDTPCMQVLKDASDRAKVMRPLLVATNLAVTGPCGHLHPVE